MKLQRDNTSFELTLSLFVLIVLLLGFAVGVLVPEIQRYLTLEEQHQAGLRQTHRLQQSYDALYAAKEKTEASAAALAERLDAPLDADAVGAWVSKFLPGAEVVPEPSTGALRVTAPVKTPMAFYAFADRLDTAPWVFRVGPSVVMQRNGEQINITFTLQAATHAAVSAPLRK